MPDQRPWYVRYHLAPDLKKPETVFSLAPDPTKPRDGLARFGRFFLLTYLVFFPALGFGLLIVSGILTSTPVTIFFGVVGLLFIAILLRRRRAKP